MSEEGISVQKAREMSREEKEKLIRIIEQEARDNEVVYWGCCRSVLKALQRHLNLGDAEVAKAASPFPAGVAGMGEICGALIGAVMAIGLAYAKGEFEAGKVNLEQPEDMEAIVRASKFGERFKEKFGCVRCSDVWPAVRGAHYKEYPDFGSIEAFEDHAWCGDVTGPAARLAAEIILQPTELFADGINAFLEQIRQVRKLQESGLK